MRRIVYICIAALFGISCAFAQNKTTMLQRMNDIKNNSDVYFWDQYTDYNADTAKVKATQRLLLDVNLNRGESEQLSVEGIMPYADYINIDRGTKKQYFVYIKKSDAIAIGHGSQTTIYRSVADRPVADTPAQELRSVMKDFVPDAFVQRIMQTRYFPDVYKLLKSLQTQGEILQFGKLKDVEDYSSLELILFDMQSQEIVTMLSPVTMSGGRTNMVNGSEDALDNYPTDMTAVIWYIKK